MTKSADTSDIPIIDVQKYMNNDESAKEQCKKVVQSLHEHGILIVKDTVSSLVFVRPWKAECNENV